MRVKICGITQIEQGKAIVNLGADSIGFICVPESPRYVTPDRLKAIADSLPSKTVKVGVFANHGVIEIISVVEQAHLSAIQLHGAESPEFCRQLRQKTAPEIELIKALRLKSAASLAQTSAYLDCVDTLLLDAYHPQMLGGTGHTINWQDLAQFKPAIPWLLAGGLTPNNIGEALSHLQPDGVDLSSGVERSPGDKDLAKVAQLFAAINGN
ncbi:MAG: phosphoribosylanthranilate isomerase [Pleurocapsa sp. SU_5_0]|nr:phosphoribosylanthranilate isomerase [Pleurocapsa sp. SU_5_0]NJO98336.1 phosphoribosylanthranilate isomerase [Pleurocapsa sp. CRU_1_2]NJR47834.1 phosphoribosylanthranilate isomerase [Hyellaceae cyanobacterium CSU_1_1]